MLAESTTADNPVGMRFFVNYPVTTGNILIFRATFTLNENAE